MISTDPYWTEDLEIGVTELEGEPFGVRFRVASQLEPYWEGRELVPIAKRGERLYVHAQAYILWPVITLTAGMPATATGGALGVVLGSDYTGVRPVEIGDCQGWCYPEDGVTVLWECLVGDRYRTADPSEDSLLVLLWEGFERVLLERAPGTVRVVTPSWEPLYEPPTWHRFLEGKGYSPVVERAWAKEVGK